MAKERIISRAVLVLIFVDLIIYPQKYGVIRGIQMYEPDKDLHYLIQNDLFAFGPAYGFDRQDIPVLNQTRASGDILLISGNFQSFRICPGCALPMPLFPVN